MTESRVHEKRRRNEGDVVAAGQLRPLAALATRAPATWSSGRHEATERVENEECKGSSRKERILKRYRDAEHDILG